MLFQSLSFNQHAEDRVTQAVTTSVMSNHATTRCQQRGVPLRVLSSLLDHGDRSIPVGGGHTAISLSRNEAARLRRVGYHPAMLERLVGLTAVVSNDGQVVTVLHATDARYRRVWH